MNERIKELADEAAKFSAIMALPTGEAGDNLFVAKFAELLIRECLASIPSDGHRGDFGRAVEFCQQQIKQHFGVNNEPTI